MNVAICITACNEEATIGALVRALKEQGFVVLVGDDSSTDATASEAERAGAVLDRHEHLGIARSMLRLWRMALGTDAEQFVQMDAGGSHWAGDCAWLLQFLRWSDIVIGTRFITGARYEGRAWRQYASRLASVMCNRRTGEYWSDWTSGYRAFNCKALKLLSEHDYHCRMHGWQIEVLGHAVRDKLRIVEVPIRYKAGRTSLRLSTAVEAFEAWTRL